MSVVRAILLCDDEHLILASRAVQFMVKNPERRDAYLAYGDKIEMYAKRLKASITVRQVKP